jgi:protein-tyrosine-phosphatase
LEGLDEVTVSDVDAWRRVKRRLQSVLFVCSENSVRSPIAEALARKLVGNTAFLASVGLRRGQRDDFVAEVLRERGIEAPLHQPRSLDEMEDEAFDAVVCLTPEARARILEITGGLEPPTVLYWPTLDPTLVEGSRENVLDAYRAVRDELARHIRDLFAANGSPKTVAPDIRT